MRLVLNSMYLLPFLSSNFIRSSFIYNLVFYEKAPLYKSHSEYGFVEPIKYFVPSIEISQILKANNSFGQYNNENYFLHLWDMWIGLMHSAFIK